VVAITGGDMQPIKVTAYDWAIGRSLVPSLVFSFGGFITCTQICAVPNSPMAAFPGLANGMEGGLTAFEFWASYRVTDWWPPYGGANGSIRILRFKQAAAAPAVCKLPGMIQAISSRLRSSMNVRPDIALDARSPQDRALPAPPSPSYVELDGRMPGPHGHLEISLAVQILPPCLPRGISAPTPNTLQVGPVGSSGTQRFYR